VETLILSKEQNSVVAARAAKLRSPVLHGIDDKPAALASWLAERGIDAGDAVYVGNDVNDLGCMAMVGYACAPADARPEAIRAAAYLSPYRGGHGAVRDICECIIAHNGAGEREKHGR
jgi:N-acylneuraminate cytidylyltransferase